jgi:CubicO group peptidase (beta-lactamase class C family)/D-alanyl-D-alanine dipeptidase
MNRSAIVAAWLLATIAPASAQETIAARGRYASSAEVLERFLAREVEDKGLPALSIALVDDHEIVWARGFGSADPQRRIPATAETIFRVGSISELFAAIAAMQLVERGHLDLDAPVGRALHDFAPANPSGRPLTLRHLMAHRSGLVREPSVGHEYDPSRPSLAETVRSLNRTELVFPPGSRTKDSKADLAVVGAIVEAVRDRPFAETVGRTVIRPLGLESTTFDRTTPLRGERARGLMWTYDGRTFPGPTFPLGTGPASNLDSSALDLGRFLAALFAGGRGPGGAILRPETLRSMMEPQFGGTGFGLGFALGELDGHRRVGQAGSIYGFAAELAALPDEKLGAVVLASKDRANGVTGRAADLALRCLLAARRGDPMPTIEPTTPVDPALARRLDGRFGDGDDAIDLDGLGGRLFLTPRRDGFRLRMRTLGDALIVDDALSFGQTIRPEGVDKIISGRQTLKRLPDLKPDPIPDRWAGRIGEYGWDHSVLYVLERGGKIHALIGWFDLYPLEERGEDTFAFPDWGPYEGETLVFLRGDDGRASRVVVGGISFPRRPIAGEDGATFRITPLRPVDELRAEALKAEPPDAGGDPQAPGLVDLTALDPTIKLDIRYASKDNFLGTPVYTSARAFLRRPAAEALLRAHRSLGAKGYGLLIHDAYRPWYVTRMFWDATPEASRAFVADPARGSRHNRGAAVDLTLYDRASGAPVAMVGGYDEFSDRSNPAYPGGTSLQRWHRDLLRRAMEDQGFTVNEVEWWHFDHKDWPRYPVLNATFEQID